MKTIRCPSSSHNVWALRCSAAGIGGIPELIDEGKTGMLFESGNAKELKARIGQMFATPFEYRQIALDAQKEIFGREVLYRTPENLQQQIT